MPAGGGCDYRDFAGLLWRKTFKNSKRMEKKRAKELIIKQQNEIDSLKVYENSLVKPFQSWREQTQVVIKAIFGINSNYYKRFDALAFYPQVQLISP